MVGFAQTVGFTMALASTPDPALPTAVPELLSPSARVDTSKIDSCALPECYLGYPIYADYPAQYWLKGELLPYFEKILGGVEQAEEYFGFGRAEQINNVCITGHHLAARTDVFLEPSAIRFHVATLDTAYSLATDAFHEMVHLFDFKSGAALSSGPFADLHQLISRECPEFFAQLNESNLIGSRPRFGHSEDSPGEFLASFVSSLRYLDWQARINEFDAQFRMYYGQAIEALSRNLENCSYVQPSAPIRLQLKALAQAGYFE